MELLTILLTAAVVAVTAAFLFKRSRFVRKVDQLPGPVGWPVLGNVLDVLVPRNRLMAAVERRNREWAPLYRTWAGPIAEIHLTLPEHVEVIMSSTKHVDKSLVYKFLHPWLGQGLLTSTGSKWHSHRKMITPTFHFKILDAFVDVFVEKSQILVENLMAEVGSKGCDIYPYITRCALDIICETAMGTQLNAQGQKDSDYVSAVYTVSELTLQRSIRPWLHPKAIFQLTDMGRRYEECLQVLHGFTSKVIQERKASRLEAAQNKHISKEEDDTFLGKKRQAFLDLLLEATSNGSKLTDTEIREEVDTFMFEGHDTTTAGICWSLLLLGGHKDIQEKVFEELDGIFQGSDRPATMRDLQEMKYLERVIKETLRLYPSVPFIGRCLKEDTKIGDYTVPAGCMINLHIFHVHRDPRQYPNPERFDPDNFLPERVQGRHPYAYIPFSAGPRNCIGQKFALLEEKTVLSSILRRFKLHSLEERKNLTLMNELILRPESGIKLQLSLRD